MEYSISPEVLGQRIRQLRVQQRLTQQELAGDEYTKSYVSAIEAGKTRPSLRALQRLATRLGVQPGLLLEPQPSGLTFVDWDQLPKRVRKPGRALPTAVNTGASLNNGETSSVQLDVAELNLYMGRAEAALDILKPFLDGSNKPDHMQRACYLAALAELATVRTQPNSGLPGALAYAQQGIKLAQQRGDKEGLERLRLVVGSIYSRAGQRLSALEQFQACLEAVDSGTLADTEFEMELFSQIIECHIALRNGEQALATYRRAEQLLDIVSRLERYAALLGRVGLKEGVSRERGYSPSTIPAISKPVVLYKYLQALTTAALMLQSIGELLTIQGEFAGAETVLARRLDLADRIGSIFGRVQALASLARLSLSRGAIEEARGRAREAVETGRQLVLAAHTGGDAEEADDSGPNEAHAAAGRVRSNGVLADALAALGSIAAEQGSLEDADTAFNEAVALLEENGDSERISRIFSAYAQVLVARGEYEKAARCYERSYAAATSRRR